MPNLMGGLLVTRELPRAGGSGFGNGHRDSQELRAESGWVVMERPVQIQGTR